MADLGALISAHVPALLLMIAGYVLIVVEMYIPGFGLPGISGIVLYAIGLILMGPSALQALFLIVVTLILLGIALAVAMRSIRKGRLNKTDIVLHETVTQPSKFVDTAKQLPDVGCEGISHTVLHPAGIVQFGETKVNAVSEGDFIAANKTVVVLRTEGQRVVVREKQ